jgi:hypothetical protein
VEKLKGKVPIMIHKKVLGPRILYEYRGNGRGLA